MKTVFLLMAEYNSPSVELTQVCEKYLKMSPKEACRRAAAQDLPFPVMRDSNSQKRPYLVSVEHLAQYLDGLKEQAEREWKKVHQ